jgi:hypothetical protein
VEIAEPIIARAYSRIRSTASSRRSQYRSGRHSDCFAARPAAARGRPTGAHSHERASPGPRRSSSLATA